MKVVVLKKGLHQTKRLEDPYLNEVYPISSSVTLIKAEKEGEKNILVDTGYISYGKEILEALRKEGLEPEDIDYIINTHEHFDHTSNNYLFKNAIIIAGILEWHPNSKVKVYKSIKDIKIMDGVEIIETPGHKDPHVSVIVRTDKVYAIAGDTITKEFFVASFEKADKKIKSAEMLMDIADIIIPGHGPIIYKEDYDYVKERIEKIKNELIGL